MSRGSAYSHTDSVGSTPRSPQGQFQFASGAMPLKQKRRGQKGLEENVQRTVYISYVHHQVRVSLYYLSVSGTDGMHHHQQMVHNEGLSVLVLLSLGFVEPNFTCEVDH